MQPGMQCCLFIAAKSVNESEKVGGGGGGGGIIAFVFYSVFRKKCSRAIWNYVGQLSI